MAPPDTFDWPGPIEYRIRKAGGRTVKTWSPMKKNRSKPASAFETLGAGNYEIDFRIGKEVYSAVRFELA